MMPNSQKINSLIEAQFHYFESGKPEEAAAIVGLLMEDLYNVGRYSELWNILKRTIDEVHDLNPVFYLYRARTQGALGRPDEANEELKLLWYLVDDDPELQAAILMDIGTSFRRMGDSSKSHEIIKDYQEAYEIYDEKLIPTQEEYRELFRENQASCLLGEGTIYHYFLEQPAEAMQKYNQALQIYGEVQSADGAGVVTKQIGEILANKRFREFYDPVAALGHFRAALEIFQKSDYENRVLETLYQMARLQRDDPEESLRLFRDCFRIANKLGLLREEAVARRHIADVEFLLFQQEVALQGPPSRDSEAWHSLSRITQSLEDAAGVLTLFKFDAWSRRALTNCYSSLGEIHKWLGDNEKALADFRSALEVSNEDIFRNRLRGDVKRRLRMLLEVVQLLYRMNQDSEVENLVAAHAADFQQLELPHPTRGGVDQLIALLKTEG